MTQVSMKQTADSYIIETKLGQFHFSLRELRCGRCNDGSVKLRLISHEEEPRPHLAMGSTCKNCGYEELHVSY